MAKKKVRNVVIEKSYILKKRFVTSDGVYEIGSTYSHNDQRVIKFLKQQEII